VLRPGDLGGGGFISVGREAGEPWLFNLSYEYESPRLDLNALGYQRTQNEQMARAAVAYARPGGGGPFQSYSVVLGAESRLTTDGRGRQRGTNAFLNTNFQLHSFDYLGTNMNLAAGSEDVRELDRSGVALRRPGSLDAEVWVASDRGRPFWASIWTGGGRSLARAPLGAATYGWVGGTLALRPHPRLETQLDFTRENSAWPARYLSDDGAGHFTLAALRAPSLSVTLRQLLVLTRRLTLQGYAQLFTATHRYGVTYAAAGLPGQVIGTGALVPGPPAAGSDTSEAALNLSLVMRWEYRLGSTLYLVYTHEATGPDSRPLALWPPGLASGPARDTVLCKWTWYWSS
jgi:hypothetical protein